MDAKNRNILLVLIGVVIAVGVISSFGLPLFAGDTPKIVLPKPQATEEQLPGQWGETGGTRVDISPETVQNVIAALDRLDSYARTVQTTLEGRTATARVWVDGGWTRTDLTPPGGSGSAVHTIVGDGTVWRWYGFEREAHSWPADGSSADVDGQRIPTYEEVLLLDPDRITAAGYEEKNGVPCVYVETKVPELNQTERYWISEYNGLLETAETETDGRIVWSMTASAPEIPAPLTPDPFTLPNGEALASPTDTGGQEGDRTTETASDPA